MKTAKLLLLTAAAIGVASFAVPARSADRRPDLGARPRLLERAKAKLNLSDDQIAKIKTELKSERDTLKTLLSNFHAARIELRQAIHANDANESSVRAASAKVAAAEADLTVERLKLYGRISPILTAEQREKVRELQGRLDNFIERLRSRKAERLAD